MSNIGKKIIWLDSRGGEHEKEQDAMLEQAFINLEERASDFYSPRGQDITVSDIRAWANAFPVLWHDLKKLL